MAELVVGGALLRIGQHIVGLLGFLEPGFGLVIVLIAVRMVLHRETPVSFLQISFVGVPGYAQNFVIIAFRHWVATSLQLPASGFQNS